MPFITDCLSLLVEGPGEKTKAGFAPLVQISRGNQFGYKDLSECERDAKIHWKGDYSISEGHWLCAKPLVRIDMEYLWNHDKPDLKKWKWFLEYFFNQKGQHCIFYEESAQDIMPINNNIKTNKERYILPMFVIEVLVEKGLIKDESILIMLDARKHKGLQEYEKEVKLTLDIDPNANVGRVPDTELSKEEILTLLAKTDPNQEFKQQLSGF